MVLRAIKYRSATMATSATTPITIDIGEFSLVTVDGVVVVAIEHLRLCGKCAALRAPQRMMVMGQLSR